VVEFSRSGQEKQNKAASGKKIGTFEMTFTGTLIESLMATVERAEQRTSSDEPMFAQDFVQNMDAQPWLVAIQQNNVDYDPKFLGVA
jgi:hypothetical protein